MKLYRLNNGVLESIETIRKKLVNGYFIDEELSEDELKGWKPLIKGEVPTVEFPVYQTIETYYTDDGVSIVENYHLIDNSIEINTSFWANNYIEVTVLTSDKLFIPRYLRYTDESSSDILKDRLNSLVIDADNGYLYENGIVLYTEPDYTQSFTAEYIDTLAVTITDKDDLLSIVNFLHDVKELDTTAPSIL